MTNGKKEAHMSKGDYDSGIPDEAKNFKVPPDIKTENRSGGPTSKRESFLAILKTSLDQRVRNKFMTQEEADGKLERAEIIDEATLPADLHQAAELFVSSGNSDESEITRILKSKEIKQGSRVDAFLKILTTHLDIRVRNGFLTQEEAGEKLKRAGMLDEATLPEDLDQAAKLFASAGNSKEKETAAIFNSGR